VVTAVDSSVLLDILTVHPAYRVQSEKALRAARQLGSVVACPVVWAEVRAFFPDPRLMESELADAGIFFDPFDQACAEIAGALWREYRNAGGSRERLIPDFLVGAHARVKGGRLLTRDRGFYRRYFHDLQLPQ
jgi:predicted nucleic acid-binding protein